MDEPDPLLTFEEASRQALRIGRRMTLPQRIRWLEEAEELGLRLQLGRWKTGQGVDPRLRLLFETRFAHPAAVAEKPDRYQSGL
jgi:hypothetical protein